jgi:peptidyl-prolyl cis-trans isomerase A (cyclophilin A)
MRTKMMFVVTSLLAFAGCEKKSTDKGGGALPKEPAPDPAPGARKTAQPQAASGDVRAPEAADLAEYTKDLPGSGNKLFAKFTTPLGDINCELFPDKAPATVANFIGLATGKKAWLNPKTSNTEKGTPYFDGLIFHRVIPGFMVQGGDPLGQGVGGPGYKFADELSPEMDMGPGTLAMANAGPVTNGSQFFIMDNASRPDLAKKHSIFGMCKELDVVAKITATPTGAQDKPETPVTMKVTITKG